MAGKKIVLLLFHGFLKTKFDFKTTAPIYIFRFREDPYHPRSPRGRSPPPVSHAKRQWSPLPRGRSPPPPRRRSPSPHYRGHPVNPPMRARSPPLRRRSPPGRRSPPPHTRIPPPSRYSSGWVRHNMPPRARTPPFSSRVGVRHVSPLPAHRSVVRGRSPMLGRDLGRGRSPPPLRRTSSYSRPSPMRSPPMRAPMQTRSPPRGRTSRNWSPRRY